MISSAPTSKSSEILKEDGARNLAALVGINSWNFFDCLDIHRVHAVHGLYVVYHERDIRSTREKYLFRFFIAKTHMKSDVQRGGVDSSF